MEFEAEARRVIEALFGASPGDCQPEHYVDSGPLTELDGLLRTRDVSHLVMVTTSTRLGKIKADVRKLEAAARVEEKVASAVALWLVTERQLDAEHVGIANRAGVKALTLDQLRRRFFNGQQYIAVRRQSVFGSARNLRDDSISIPEGEYVPLPMQAVEKGRAVSSRRVSASRSVDVAWIGDRVSAGEVVVLMAPFGAGKSLTTRELFLNLAGRFGSDPAARCPIALNLRDHWGQDEGAEILERHARKISFAGRTDLMPAWRAGMTSLLLDGFDEVGSQTVASLDNKRFLADARHKALRGVRELVTSRPNGSGVLICGRDHYFDTIPELEAALGLSEARSYWIVQLGEFTDEGIATFLSKAGSEDRSVPEWLPRKPLLLAYLVHHQLLAEVLGLDEQQGFGYVWDAFIDRICAREVRLEGAAMDAVTIRKVLEYLSLKVRASRTGLGPITGLDLAEAYEQVAHQAPGEGVLPHLQRLPALSVVSEDPGSRYFVDEDMLAALQGGAIASFACGGFEGRVPTALEALRPNALKMAAHKASELGMTAETLVSLVGRLARHRDRGETRAESANMQAAADLLEVTIELAIACEQTNIDFRSAEVEGAIFGIIRADEVLPSHIRLVECTIQELRLAHIPPGTVPFQILGGDIAKIGGCASREAIPRGVVDGNTHVEAFDSLATNAAVLRSDLPPSVKALVTVLRKLYKQAGAGRKISALKRGITDDLVRSKLDAAIECLEREGLLRMFNQVAHPVRSNAGRVERILSAPALSDDPVCVWGRSIG